MMRGPLKRIGMHVPSWTVVSVILGFCVLTAPARAQPDLAATLAQVARYEHGQGRQALLDLEAILRRMPGGEAEPWLIRFLESESTLAGKDVVCRQLSLLGSSAAVPVLERMLTADDTVEMARYALERIAGDASLRALRAAFPLVPAKARPGILNTLGVRGDPAAVELMTMSATSSDSLLRDAAIHALGRDASAEALAALGGLRDSGSLEAMEALLVAAEQLARTGQSEQALTVYRNLLNTNHPAKIRAGALLGIAAHDEAAALPLAATGLSESDLTYREAAVTILRPMRMPAATEVLKNSLANVDAPTRVQVVTALAVRGDADAREAVIEATSDTAMQVRVAALESLAMLEAPGTVGSLAQRAAQESLEEQERVAARLALGRMRGEAVDQAIVAGIPAVANPVKLELIRAAGDRGIPGAADAILPLVSDSDRVLRREALRGLRETAGVQQVPVLLDMLAASRSQADRRELERVLAAALRRSPPAATARCPAPGRAGTSAGGHPRPDGLAR